MKTVNFAILGFFGGLIAAVASLFILTMSNHDEFISRLCIGAVVGPVVGIVLARRGPKAPPADTGSR